MSDLEKSDGQSMEEILASIRSSVDAPGAEHGVAPAPPGAAPRTGHEKPPLPASSRNGSGRLQDALSQIAVASSLSAARPNGTSMPSPPPTPSTGAAPPATPAVPVVPSDDALDDLFESESAPEAVTPASGAAIAAEPDPAKAFGSTPKPNDALNAPTELENASVPKAPEPTLTAGNSMKPEPAAAPPVSNPAVAPVRKPDFSKLNALASGSAPGTNAGDDMQSSSAQSKSDVLLPEMRTMASSNPVAQMHSMAAAMAGSSRARVAPQHDAQTPAASVENSSEDSVETEIVAAPAPAKETSAATGGDTAVPDRSASQPGSVSGGRTLEDIVADLLKPQLEKWLEANMPRIVERALRAEQKGPTGQDSN